MTGSPSGRSRGWIPSTSIHAGTASKVLAPGLRLGWLSLPADLVEPVIGFKHITDSGLPDDRPARAGASHRAWRLRTPGGSVPARVSRPARPSRRGARPNELPGLVPRGVAAGVHVLLPLPDGADDVAIATAAEAQSISVRPLSPSYLPGAERGTTPARGLILGYARLPLTQDRRRGRRAGRCRAWGDADRPSRGLTPRPQAHPATGPQPWRLPPDADAMPR